MECMMMMVGFCANILSNFDGMLYELSFSSQIANLETSMRHFGNDQPMHSRHMCVLRIYKFNWFCIMFRFSYDAIIDLIIANYYSKHQIHLQIVPCYSNTIFLRSYRSACLAFVTISIRSWFVWKMFFTK